MKILYVVHSFPPFHWRGSEVYALELATAVSARHQAHVFHLVDDPAADSAAMERDSFQGLPVHRVRRKLDPSEPESYFFHPPQEELFRGLVNEIGPEVVHFIYYAGGLSLGLARVAAEQGAKVVITATDFSGPCPRAQLIDRDGAPCAGPREGVRCFSCLFGKPLIQGHSRISRVLARRLPPGMVSADDRPELALLQKRLQAVRQAFARAWLVIYPNANTREVHHRASIKAPREKAMDYGIDLARFAGHRKSPSPIPRIAFIGQLLPHKGLAVLARAMDSMPDAVKLVCHGSGEDQGAEEYLDSLGDRRDRIEFRGTFAFERMNRVLEDIDVLVVPSQWQENCPLIVKYALATGTWAVLADQAGMVALRRGLARVRFFPPRDHRRLARVLIEVLDQVRKEREGAKAFSMNEVVESGAVIDVRDQALVLEELYGGEKSR